MILGQHLDARVVERQGVFEAGEVLSRSYLVYEDVDIEHLTGVHPAAAFPGAEGGCAVARRLDVEADIGVW